MDVWVMGKKCEEVGVCCIKLLEALLITARSFCCFGRVFVVAVDADGRVIGVSFIGDGVEIFLTDGRW